MATIDLPYVQHRGGHYRYRRKVPLHLRDVIGKREIVIPLGRTSADAARLWAKANAEAERRLVVKAPEPTPIPTPAELHGWAIEYVRSLNLDRGDGGADSLDQGGLIADSILERYPVEGNDKEGFYPVGVTERDAALLRVLGQRHAKAPEATLEDARRFYIREKVKGSPDEVSKTQRIDRTVKHITEALDRGAAEQLTLASLTKEDARDIRDHMLRDTGIKSPATVHRYLNVIRAVITHAIDDMPLPGLTNPFSKLKVKGLDGKDGTHSKDDRKPMPEAVAGSVRKRAMSDDLRRIWAMLEGTGMRVGEVTGLMAEDLHLDHARPYVDLKPHPHRRLKNNGSKRLVPLVGGALDAAREALQTAGEGPMLFDSYARDRGANAASASLMKHVRAVTTDRKVTVHSLRHWMKDRLRLAGVSKDDQDLILGHASTATGEKYGGDPEVILEVAQRALHKAFTA